MMTDPGKKFAGRTSASPLLDHRPFRWADDDVVGRAGIWKTLLLTRTDGHNRN
jgi:hypothetical protein